MGKVNKNVVKQAPKEKVMGKKLKLKEEIKSTTPKVESVKKIKSKGLTKAMKSKKIKTPMVKKMKKGLTLDKSLDESIESEVPSILLRKQKSFLNEATVKSGIKACLELSAKKEKNVLFDDEKPIFLQINVFKIPKCPSRMLRFTLAYPITRSNREICLIVSDLKNNAKDHDKAIEHYETLLADKGVKVKTIIPFDQLRSEYSEFEMQRRLVELYDVFLIDGRIKGHFAGRFSKNFIAKRKMPTCVKLQATNLKQQFDKALLKTEMRLHGNGDSFALQIGHNKMTEEEIYENVTSVHDAIEGEFPGGFENIRNLQIKVEGSVSVPLYASLKRNADVDVPVVKAKRPKAFHPVKDEISTGKIVTVLPSGNIIVDDVETDVSKKGDGKKAKETEEDSDEEETEVNDESDESDSS